jgi:hypothetical protein
LHGVAWLQVQRAELTGYDSQASELAAWTVLGTLSTASHGVGLILTAPFWVISGAASTAKQSRCGYVRYPPAIREDFLPYARFPQGLPPEVDRSRLGGGPVRAVPRQPRARDSMPGS